MRIYVTRLHVKGSPTDVVLLDRHHWNIRDSVETIANEVDRSFEPLTAAHLRSLYEGDPIVTVSLFDVSDGASGLRITSHEIDA